MNNDEGAMLDRSLLTITNSTSQSIQSPRVRPQPSPSIDMEPLSLSQPIAGLTSLTHKSSKYTLSDQKILSGHEIKNPVLATSNLGSTALAKKQLLLPPLTQKPILSPKESRLDRFQRTNRTTGSLSMAPIDLAAGNSSFFLLPPKSPSAPQILNRRLAPLASPSSPVAPSVSQNTQLRNL